jgi:hypothetical protein
MEATCTRRLAPTLWKCYLVGSVKLGNWWWWWYCCCCCCCSCCSCCCCNAAENSASSVCMCGVDSGHRQALHESRAGTAGGDVRDCPLWTSIPKAQCNSELTESIGDKVGLAERALSAHLCQLAYFPKKFHEQLAEPAMCLDRQWVEVVFSYTDKSIVLQRLAASLRASITLAWWAAALVEVISL